MYVPRCQWIVTISDNVSVLKITFHFWYLTMYISILVYPYSTTDESWVTISWNYMQYIQLILMVNGSNRPAFGNFSHLAIVCLVLCHLSLTPPKNKMNICIFCLLKNVLHQKFGNLTTKISIDLKKNIGNLEQAGFF